MPSHRICSVFGCGNSYRQLTKWQNQISDIHKVHNGSESCVSKPPFVLFPFPTEITDPDGRKKWTSCVNRKDTNTGKNWTPSRYSRICSLHFPLGKPTLESPYPSLYLSNTSTVKQPRKAPIKRVCESNICEKSIKKRRIETVTQSYSEDTPSCSYSKINVSDHDYTHCAVECSQSGQCENEQCKANALQKDEQFEVLKGQIKRLNKDKIFYRKSLLNREKQPFSHTHLVNDKQIRIFTGIPNRKAFNRIFSHISPRAKRITYWHGVSKLSSNKRSFKRTPKKSGPRRLLPLKDEFLLTLMKLRLGHTNADLSQRFGISSTTVSKIFHTWIRFLSNELKCLIYNPPKDYVREHLPTKFKRPKYCKVRHIIDCTEVFIETPNDPQIRTATWSDYKHHNTAKILVSILPTGAFNFVSDAWGGRTSDVHITRESGFYDILEDQDEVMADKGFTIAEDLMIRHCKLHMPPGKRGYEQMRKADIEKTKDIANLRIIVEQAIRRLKTFHILKFEMPITLMDKIDDVIIVCAALCNLYAPLMT